jgi:iron(III) transport system ATP-binding protein
VITRHRSEVIVSHIRISGLSKHFDSKPPTKAIDDLDLEIAEGEFLVLLGPSGCGKTTTLRCLAGLEEPGQGSIVFGDTTVFDAQKKINLPPDRRNIGMVFQSYALWPHLTVRKNIAYPLKARRIKQGLAENWVGQMADLVDCGALLDRYPSQLSGGQQQRVALARGLVARPDLVLFDEPLSNLDARLRDQVRAEIHELHGRLGFTAVFVTHDQSEALALGDKLAIMKQGRIEQYASPDDVYERPASEYVAAFIGMSNRLEARYQDGRWTIEGVPVHGRGLPADGGHVVGRLRPEELTLAAADAAVPEGRTAVSGSVIDSEFGGRTLDVSVDLNGVRLMARIAAGERGGWARGLRPGQAVQVLFDPGAARWFSQEQGAPTTAIAPEVVAP